LRTCGSWGATVGRDPAATTLSTRPEVGGAFAAAWSGLSIFSIKGLEEGLSSRHPVTMILEVTMMLVAGTTRIRV
jgi:hypothetical protein